MVSATDSQGQSGSVSFTWTVTGAPTTGPTGQVQLALGECLTAAGSNDVRNPGRDQGMHQ